MSPRCVLAAVLALSCARSVRREVPPCDEGEAACDVDGGAEPICVDPRTDVRHCGGCDNTCGPDQLCEAGFCVTPAGPDVDVDVDVDADVDDACDENCSDPTDPTVPPCSSIGEACRDERDCEAGFRCIADEEGWPDGYCTVGGAYDGPCTAADPSTCPSGSRCLGGYCMKECVITGRNPWDASSCGCRDGYECEFLYEVCVPGCTPGTVAESCCQYWFDEDGDFIEDSGEFRDVPGCIVGCDEDSSRCVNPGDPAAHWGDVCVLDQECPEGGTCIRDRDLDGIVGGERGWPGGLCTRYECDSIGRGCGEGAVCDPLFGSGSLCLDECDSPGGGFGAAVGCRDDDYACYGSGAGAGVCLPNCATRDDPDGFCDAFWGGARGCDLVTGTCD